ncbi:hypothetical protein Poli38472_005661 [Pythium oligandrum]|uniref:Non-specific serine/threonine protein kinase n=1 Tax=Pythium oligandrum TaxID=41045 RepID=A0A8K1FLU8_PYTOL|nr:hypothetical protein Poli38472_005661 [Pythium oligandrum]|eukprot:TMW63043.1 hypothetical protein Poli38472_005661 [Pythium oligandrum]
MGVSLFDRGCLGGSATAKETIVQKVAYEGMLRYQSKAGKWKERWFVLDPVDFSLVKCIGSTRQPSVTHGSICKRLQVAEVRPLSLEVSTDAVAQAGIGIRTKHGQTIRFLTKTKDEEIAWMKAMRPFSLGFTDGMTERIATRELLAGKYAFVRELGRGAAGIVSLYTYQGQPYAIKKFVPQKAKGVPNRRAVPATGAVSGPTDRNRSPHSVQEIPEEIRREIALLKKASHLPYVIKLHDVILDPEQGNYHLVMEYMGGGAIAEWDGDRKCYVSTKQNKSMSRLEEKTVRLYMTQVLLGLQALHQNHLCHRDIKPENLMATDDRSVCKIGDLGVAHYFREENGELKEEANPEAIELWSVDDGNHSPQGQPSTVTSNNSSLKGMLKSTKGTYQFLPPEALSGDEFDGFKADIWAVGVTMYALLFGYLPFYSNDLVKLFEKIENDAVVFPSSCQDNELKGLLQQLLEKDPEKRISIDTVLQHGWFHRQVDSKALQLQVHALKRAPALCVDASDLGGAVSVLQSRFELLSKAMQHSTLKDLQEAASAPLKEPPSSQDVASTPYQPRPIQTSDVILPDWMQLDRETLAAQLHFDWCRSKHLAGWVHGPMRDDGARVHPSLVPIRDLPSDAHELNLRCVDETLKCILALGCRVEKKRTRFSWSSSSRSPPTSSCNRAITSSSSLLPVDMITLSWKMLLLLEMLAENAHEVWADGYIKNSWRHGQLFDAEAKTHPSLRPFVTLGESEKQLSRDGVSTVLKACLALGYSITCSRSS